MERTHKTRNANGRTRPKKLYDESDEERLDLKIDSIREKTTTPCFVYVLTFFAALGGFLFGYDTSVISGAMILLRNEFGLTSVWQEMIVSVTVGAAALFALIGGALNDRMGRRGVILIACSVFTAAAILMGISVDKYMLLSGRVLAGAAIGLMSTTVPMYLAEISPISIRGRLVSTNIAMVACGQFFASVVDGIFGSDEKNGWRYMLGLAGIPSFIQFVGFIFMPESPRWLIVSLQEEKARRVLQSIRGQLDIEEEYENIKSNCLEMEQEGHLKSRLPVICQIMQFPSIRRALAIGCSLQVIQQIAGINTVMPESCTGKIIWAELAGLPKKMRWPVQVVDMPVVFCNADSAWYYSATIIKMSGVRSDVVAIWLSSVTAAVNFLFTLLGIYLVERIGRRPLTIGSLIGAIASLVLLAVGFHVASLNTPKISKSETFTSNSSCFSYRTCDECMLDLACGFCFEDGGKAGIVNSSCLAVSPDNPWVPSSGRCNSPESQGKLTWAYDYCPSPYSWMPMVGLILYLITFAPGMGPMPWTINSEIYPLWARSSAISVSTFSNWVFNLLVSMSFLTLMENLTRFGTFLLYAGLSMLGALLLFVWLSETKGKSLEEVEGLFASPWCGVSVGTDYNTKTIQYVHIRGLNRDGRESELDSPE